MVKFDNDYIYLNNNYILSTGIASPLALDIQKLTWNNVKETRSFLNFN